MGAVSQRAEITQSIVAELQPLLGSKIQRIDVVGPGEVVLELRCPGRTFRWLLSARPGAARTHLIEERPPRTAPGGALQALLRKRLVGRSLLALEAVGRTIRLAGEDVGLEVRLDRGKEAFRFLAEEERPGPGTAPAVDSFVALRFPENEAAAARYQVQAPAQAEAQLRAQLLAVLKKAEKKCATLVANLEGDRQALLALSADGQHGELLKTVLHQVRRGASSVQATNWETGEAVIIPLDPALGPKENLERFFRRAKRATRGLEKVEQRLTQERARQQALAAERALLSAAELSTLLARAEAREGEVGAPALEKRGGAPRRHPLDAVSRAFVAADGSEIRVGKGAKENDRLTFGGARADDIWLHAQGPGAHVVLRNAKGKSPHPDALLDAAHLAAHYSSHKGETKVEVIWTEARYVKKTKGAPPGQVGVSKARTLIVELQPARIQRLFQGR